MHIAQLASSKALHALAVEMLLMKPMKQDANPIFILLILEMASVNPEEFQLLVLENAKLNAALKASEYEREKLLTLVQNLIASQAVFLTLVTTKMSMTAKNCLFLFKQKCSCAILLLHIFYYHGEC